MALPPSGPISINDIRIELGQAQGNNSLRTLSSLAGFSAPDAMSEFYGYPPSTKIFLVEPGTPSQGEVCSLSGGEFEVWWGGSGCPDVGNTLYLDSGLTTPFDGKSLWWKSYQCNAGFYIFSDGFIEGKVNC